MKLLFLHGAPAAGKLTVAKALLEQVPGRLFDNHAAIDLARTLFDFGAPGFWELVMHQISGARRRGRTRRSACGHDLLLCRAGRPPQFQKLEEIVQRHGGELLPVFLHCSREEALRRVGNPDRVERRKMASAEALNKYLDDYKFTAVPRAGCLTLDTGRAGGSGRAGNHWPFWAGPA